MRTPARFREARVYARALGEAEVAAAASRSADGLVLWLDVADARQVKPGGGAFYLGYGGDYGPTTTPSDENFCQNGVVTADRVPQPSMGEIRKMQQYVDTQPLDLREGEVRVDNGYDFTNLAEIAERALPGARRRSGDRARARSPRSTLPRTRRRRSACRCRRSRRSPASSTGSTWSSR